ncbi:membrane dipeptidase [Caldicellulosiruptor naganoensis]|uniref:Membrane dipeptidase n=1 Tax=Caldicellulosiruptor naganoensis TaxID=29324 RepID=A0ABY7BME6_9FIRM|nr:membrane dipeptidase [Caldicellulosiruptor naganoensis]WAM32721.1 membrane dipeptidase [Caldicellulosiruptor naganoensis]
MSFVNSLEDVEILKENGIISATLSWNHKNKLCGGAYEDGNLSSFGKEILKKLLDLNFIIDLAHAPPRTFFDVVAVVDRPFIVSHSNCWALCNHPRNLTDEQLKDCRKF